MNESSECSTNAHKDHEHHKNEHPMNDASKTESVERKGGDDSSQLPPGEPSEIAEMKKKIQELEAQVKEKEAKYLYLYADFDNFKKRSIKERSDLIKFGWEPVAREMVQNLDNLELALAHIPPSTDKNLADGLKMILNQLLSSLQRQGVQPIESLEKVFDPNLHEAVGQEESDFPSGTITKEHTRGYTLHGRLLRPARVVISGGRSSDTETK